jgi:hypothetical protein
MLTSSFSASFTPFFSAFSSHISQDPNASDPKIKSLFVNNFSILSLEKSPQRQYHEFGLHSSDNQGKSLKQKTQKF